MAFLVFKTKICILIWNQSKQLVNLRLQFIFLRWAWLFCLRCSSNKDKMQSLNDLNPGETATVAQINGTTDDLSYLMELGMLKGTVVRFVKTAPLGDPIEVDFRGYHLSIRRENAEKILVNLVTKASK